MNRRGFFKGLAQAVAIISLAPRLAFKAPALSVKVMEVPVAQVVPFWFESNRYSLCTDKVYREWLKKLSEQNARVNAFGE